MINRYITPHIYSYTIYQEDKKSRVQPRSLGTYIEQLSDLRDGSTVNQARNNKLGMIKMKLGKETHLNAALN
ncbi:hypothetical protein C8R44DRAFT_756870 [Mycena epipterygia]|nr:hypothetical protein C8R44DRAFT_756870 [Mycena epipterygia]